MLSLVVLMINLPLVHSTWTRWQVERNGTDVTATLVDNDVLGGADDPAYWISYTLPSDIDPDQLEWAREVEKAAYDAAVASGTRHRPRARRQPGDLARRGAGRRHVPGWWPPWSPTCCCVGFLWVLWRFGRYGRPELLRLEALGDVVAGATTPAWTSRTASST